MDEAQTQAQTRAQAEEAQTQARTQAQAEEAQAQAQTQAQADEAQAGHECEEARTAAPRTGDTASCSKTTSRASRSNVRRVHSDAAATSCAPQWARRVSCVWSTTVRSCGGRSRAGPAKGRSASVRMRATRTRSRRDRRPGARGIGSEDACGTDLRGRRAMPIWRTADGDEVRTRTRAAARPCGMRGRRPTSTPRARSAAIRWPRASRTPISGFATSADKTSRSEPWCWGVGTATTISAAPARAWGRERSTDRMRGTAAATDRSTQRGAAEHNPQRGARTRQRSE